MRRGDGAKFKHLLCPIDDLRLQRPADAQWGVWHIVWGGGGFLPFPPFPSVTPSCCGVLFFRLDLRLPCLFPNLPRIGSPSGPASQTWPCHILGSHKGWFLRNRCLPNVDVLKGGFFSCLGQASVSLGAPRMPTSLPHHGSQNRIQKTSRNMAARKGPRLYKKQSGTRERKSMY